MRLSIAVFSNPPCRNAEKQCDYGGWKKDQGVGQAVRGAEGRLACPAGTCTVLVMML